MSPRTRTITLLPLGALGAAALALPTAGFAVTRNSTPGSGGAAPSGGTAAGPDAASQPAVRPANATLTTSGDGITVAAKESAVRGWKMRLSGRAPASDAGDTVVIERETGAGASWVAASEAPVRRNGSFSVLWRANVSGRVALKAAVALSSASSARSHRASPAPADSPSTPPLTVTVYRPARATLYGPGFWGHQTACGLRLHRTTLGVANRDLPCGTRVTVLFRGQTITVRVIDRGPFAHGASWDLTAATARALGMTGTSTVGTVTNG